MKKQEFLKLDLNYDNYTYDELGKIANKNRTLIYQWLKSEQIPKKYSINHCRVNINETRICYKCQKEKDLLEFPKNKSKSKGFDFRCKLCLKEFNESYYENNKQKMLSDAREYSKSRRKTDIAFKLLTNLRRRHNLIIKGKMSTTKGLDCNSEFLKKYIESLFTEGMNWTNQWIGRGDSTKFWSIDHKIPLSEFGKNEELDKQIIHYTNLKPMWHKENLEKHNYYE